ncbi:hypothetical protein MGG_05214 [Pyricularia oryzae 70-15]|nr:uncharacterized protein MGG_05214 [Pyricularia oryzae 70-15]ELQ39077.1 hypothetical protein OOU_Y34scaffold00516g112 [Pyricularia oryzae Y34]KAI6550357.1 hypothetical protein MCOR03_009497 [Pyricularia oryzae]EHA52954.1 hypothetical protein MGG_05214 [Pyricularia oryzae 70-15]KAI7911807.1 hypothetical protein M9X92_010355 [Pyricularia oryzae]KAI7912822.1 hypothetical protein M0657_010291 [Pyricularia oryzae]
MVETQSPTVIIVSVIFAVFIFAALSLRFWARAVLVKQIGTDDVLITIATIFSFAFIGTAVRAAQLGLGAHIDDVLPRGTENLVAYAQTVWLSSIMYNACLGFIKVSVLALYMRLGDKRLRTLAVVMIVLVTAQTVASVMVCILQCTPVRAAYDVTMSQGSKTCININAFYLANAACNILTDLLTYSLPIPLVLRLQVTRPQRIGLAVMLSLGLLACASSVIRITFIPAMLVSQDPTWDIAQPMYWSVIETNVGILAASIPSLKVIAKVYFPRLLGTQSGRGAGGGGTAGASSGGRCGKSGIWTSPRSSRQSRVGIDRGDGFETGFGCHEEASKETLATTGPPEGKIEVTTKVSMQVFDSRTMESGKGMDMC